MTIESSSVNILDQSVSNGTKVEIIQPAREEDNISTIAADKVRNDLLASAMETLKNDGGITWLLSSSLGLIISAIVSEIFHEPLLIGTIPITTSAIKFGVSRMISNFEKKNWLKIHSRTSEDWIKPADVVSTKNRIS